MIISKSKPITLGAAIFYGGLIAGILDAADGFVAYYFAAGLNPIQVLQFIASGFYGAAAFEKGIPGALVGLFAHFLIAFAVAAIYVGATRFLPMLSREPVMWGTIYGAAVFMPWVPAMWSTLRRCFLLILSGQGQKASRTRARSSNGTKTYAKLEKSSNS